jgi:hypothetical protein
MASLLIVHMILKLILRKVPRHLSAPCIPFPPQS